jgi:hypothetical protein
MNRHSLFAIASLLLSTTALQAEASTLKIAPHEAVYDLQMDQNRPNSQILRADGSMTFTLADACDGWTVDQKLELKFLYAQGEQSTILVTTSSWEAKDGKTYNFTSRTLNNGKQTEIFRGKANLTGTGGEAVYALPKDKKVKIPANAMFPNQHTLMILQHALAGEKVPNQLVFDGTDEKAQSDVSVFLGKSIALADEKNLSDTLQTNPLLQGVAYPASLAFFALPEANKKNEQANENEGGTPDYEIKLDLLANGIARKLLIDYGHFTVRGLMKTIKPLPESGCTTP